MTNDMHPADKVMGDLTAPELVSQIAILRSEKDLLMDRMRQIQILIDDKIVKVRNLEAERTRRIIDTMVEGRRNNDSSVTVSSIGRRYGVSHQWVSQLMKDYYRDNAAECEELDIM